MKRTILIILAAALLLAAYGCKGVLPADGTEKLITKDETTKEPVTEEETVEEITTEEVVTEDPVKVLNDKIQNRIANDAETILKQKGISPGNMFFMSFSEAISRFVTPTAITIYTCDEALKSGALSNAEKTKLLESMGSLTSDNIQIYEIKGRMMQNPEIPYLITDEETALRIALVYDNDAELFGYAILEVNRNLDTCVTIAVIQF